METFSPVNGLNMNSQTNVNNVDCDQYIVSGYRNSDDEIDNSENPAIDETRIISACFDKRISIQQFKQNLAHYLNLDDSYFNVSYFEFFNYI